MPVLVVQMGHSGRTSGATGAPGEMAFTEAVGESCRRLLNRDGWTVRTIAADPAASAYRGNAFVAVHADGSINPNVRGASVGYQTAEGAGLAHAWRARYVDLGFTGPWNSDNYTVNLAQYYGVRTAVQEGNRAACIIECGTITNAADRALMLPDRVAEAIGAAVGIQVEECDMTIWTEKAKAGYDQVYGVLVDGSTYPKSNLQEQLGYVVGRVEAVGDQVTKLAEQVAALAAKLPGA